MEIELWHWWAFAGFVFVMLVLDLGVFHRKAHAPSFRESAGWTIFWVTLALAFNALVWVWLGDRAGTEFLTGYLIEWSLSMDNVFVFAVIFAFFKVPKKYQYRVLFWGILGAVVMRLTFILLGALLVQKFAWMIPIFGAFLLYTALKLATHDSEQVNPDQNLLLRIARRLLPVASSRHIEEGREVVVVTPEASRQRADAFFVRENGKLCVTPLFLVLLVIESTDVVFAVDSVPAILGVVSQKEHYFKFVAFTSNVFAILGLRALYFMLAGMMDAFRYLGVGLSAVLAFVGIKMITHYALTFEEISSRTPHVIHAIFESKWIPLLIIVGILGLAVVFSLLADRRDARRTAKDGQEAA